MTASLVTGLVLVALCFGGEAIPAKSTKALKAYAGLTILEKQCTTMRKGLVRFVPGSTLLEVCSNGQWTSYHFARRLRTGLVGHWKMDEQTGNNVDDDSGNEHHATSSGPSPSRGKFTRGRYFNSGGVITVPHNPGINFGTTSFSVAGWVKIMDVTYPLTTFAVRKGYGCYFQPGRQGWKAGWETAHGYNAQGTRVCIRDHRNNKVDVALVHDVNDRPPHLQGKWAHYAFAFDRVAHKVRLYINGKKQSNEVDISSVTGSINNDKPLEFGRLYGWKTKGTLDEYRLYNFALNDVEAKLLYTDHRV